VILINTLETGQLQSGFLHIKLLYLVEGIASVELGFMFIIPSLGISFSYREIFTFALKVTPDGQTTTPYAARGISKL
jgi:hypothetical protein